jgi:RNA polymerase sigma-70 factor (ECF subfamily)
VQAVALSRPARVTDIEPPAEPAAVPDFDWDAAVRTHNRRVVVCLLAMGVPLDRADDVAQRAWMRLMRQANAGRLQTIRLPGLAIRQARFIALKELRREGERSVVDADDVELTAAQLLPDERIANRQTVERVLSVLKEHNPRAQTIFCLVYEDPPIPHLEIAERVGLSLQRVRQILCEVRKDMREALEADR